MKVFVAGASGFLGSAVVAELVRRRHEVTGLVRTASKAGAVEKLGASVVQGNLNTAATFAAARDADAIIHCALPDFYTKRVSASLVRSVGEQDVRWTRALIEAGAGRAKTFIYTSGGWIYGAVPDAPADEAAPLRPFAAAATKVEGEKVAQEEARKHNYPSCVIFRPGAIYGAGGTFDAFTLSSMKKGGKARWIGSGEQVVSLVHVDDAAQAYALAVEGNRGYGIYNLADNEPVSARQYMGYLAEQMKAKPPGGLPAFLIKMLGGAIAEPLTSSIKLSAARARSELGWSPRYPTYREGMKALAEQVRGAAPVAARQAA